jgi:nucleoside-diphosphate-sugar epimerase
MKLTITGCYGRIGRRTVLAALKDGHIVHGVDSLRPPDDVEFNAKDPNFTFSEVDLRDYDKTLEALRSSDAVIQLAAIPTPTDYVANTHNT